MYLFLYAQLRISGGLVSTNFGGLFSCNFSFIVHKACYCMDAIRLNGNVWINIPLRLGKLVSGMTARCECAVKGER